MTPPFPGAPTPADHFIRVAAMLVAAPVAGQSDEREAPDARKGKPSLPTGGLGGFRRKTEINNRSHSTPMTPRTGSR